MRLCRSRPCGPSRQLLGFQVKERKLRCGSGATKMRFDPNLVFDVGLHMGEDTEFYLKKGFKVVSFEANPYLVNHCQNRFADQIVRGQLHIIEGAIAPESYGDHITFYNSSNSIWGTIEPDWEERNSKLGASSSRLDVKRVDILEVFGNFGVPFYLKIDVEGVDAYVVNKLKELSAIPQYISIESESRFFEADRRNEFASRAWVQQIQNCPTRNHPWQKGYF